MAHEVETMAYAKSGGLPWHGLGFPVNDNMTTEQMLEASRCNWTVSKRPVYYERKGEKVMVPNEFALVRNEDDRVLSMVGSSWKPLQNERAFDFFRKFVNAGHMKMETAGSLWGGRYVWVLARIGKDFKVGKGDEMQNYLLFAVPHAFGYSSIIQFTAIRVVCMNTLQMALGSQLKGKEEANNGKIFRMPHFQEFTDAMAARAEEALGLAIKQVDEFKEASVFLSKAKAKQEDVELFFQNVLKFDPARSRKPEEERTREPRMLPLFREALEHSPGHALSTAAGTWWGALNAVTHVVDHELGRDRDTALRTAWVGERAELKRRAFTGAVECAKAA